MGAVIDAIDAGHYMKSGTKTCRSDDKAWPCPTISAARKVDGRGTQRADHKATAVKT